MSKQSKTPSTKPATRTARKGKGKPAAKPETKPAAPASWIELQLVRRAERAAAIKAAARKGKRAAARAAAVKTVELAYERMSKHQRAMIDLLATATPGTAMRAADMLERLPVELRDAFYVRWGLSQLVRCGWATRAERGVYVATERTLARGKAKPASKGKRAAKPAAKGKGSRKAKPAAAPAAAPVANRRRSASTKLDAASRRMDRRVAAARKGRRS
jgi:hypothetical protein